jgi:hypothetical protein
MGDEDWMKNIRFCTKQGINITDESRKHEVVNIINYAIEQEKEFLQQEGLIGNLKDYGSDLNIKIIDRGTKFEVDLGPKSGEGHDFNFVVRSRSKKLIKESLAIGEVIPEPED